MDCKIKNQHHDVIEAAALRHHRVRDLPRGYPPKSQSHNLNLPRETTNLSVMFPRFESLQGFTEFQILLFK